MPTHNDMVDQVGLVRPFIIARSGFFILALAIACGDEPLPQGSDTGGATSGDGSDGVGSDGSTSGGPATGDSGADSMADGSSGGEPTPPTGAWETKAPLAGGPRQETGVAALDGEVYVVGGFVPGGQIVAVVEAYDPTSDSWRSVADLPTPLHHANVAVLDGRLWVAGFLEGLGFEARGDVFSYDPTTDAWSTHTAMPTGTERGASVVAAHGGLVYLFGGFRGGALEDVWTYEPATDLWGVAADLPRSIDHGVAATIGDRIYVAGGRAAAIDSHTDALDVYDPSTDTWSSGPAMPTSRAGLMGGALDGRLFVAGGEGNVEAASGVFEQFEAYDPQAEQWFSLPVMPTPRHGTGAAAVDGLLFVPGGATVEALGPSDVHEAWRPG